MNSSPTLWIKIELTPLIIELIMANHVARDKRYSQPLCLLIQAQISISKIFNNNRLKTIHSIQAYFLNTLANPKFRKVSTHAVISSIKNWHLPRIQIMWIRSHHAPQKKIKKMTQTRKYSKVQSDTCVKWTWIISRNPTRNTSRLRITDGSLLWTTRTRVT